MRTSLFTLVLVGLILATATACGTTGGNPTRPPEATPTSALKPPPTGVPQTTPTSAPRAEAPAPTTVPGEVQEIKVFSEATGYRPERVTVKAGSRVRFIVTNTDSDLHALYNRGAKIDVEFAPMTTITYEWVAPQELGVITAMCTYHEGLFLKIDVVK